jgi:hypothetical protein
MAWPFRHLRSSPLEGVILQDRDIETDLPGDDNELGTCIQGRKGAIRSSIDRSKLGEKLHDRRFEDGRIESN